MLVTIGLVYMIMVILFGSLLVPLVIFLALPLAVIDSSVTFAVTGRATNIITGLAISLQAAALPVAVIAAGIWFAYCVGGGLYGVALAAVAMLSMAGIVVAAAILTPIGMPAVPTSPILMGKMPILSISSISTNAMDSFVTMA
jgi:Na+/H+-translocating membrane pyrophosphatase